MLEDGLALLSDTLGYVSVYKLYIYVYKPYREARYSPKIKLVSFHKPV